MPAFPDPDERNPLAGDCRRCGALVDCRERIAWGVGPTSATLVVVGEAPAAGTPDADQWRGGNWTGMAYTSRASGRKVREFVADLGYGGDCYYTNAVKCFPCADDENGSGDGAGIDRDNREPTAEERDNCRPYLLAELEQVDPAWVLATGRHATESLLAVDDRTLDGFLDAVLDPLDVAGIDPPVLPLLHPAYQEVWLSRLGHDRDSYLAAVESVLSTC